MKKMHVILLALMMLCTASFARSDLKKSKVAILKQDQIVRLCYESPTASAVEVSIKDNSGQEVFSEEIYEQSFIRPYNFSKLPRGDYQLSVKDNSGLQTRQIRLYDRAYIGHVTRLDGNENKYLVTIPKKGDNEVSVCVYDSDNNLVYSELAEGNKSYAKVFHLKNLKGANIALFNKD